MKITKGKKPRPQKVVIYGSEGIGKSTLAANFPTPVFLDIEGGTAQLDVARVDDVHDWQSVLAAVAEISSGDVCKTLVIDTADWAEKLCAEAVCAKAKKANIEDFGFGKGYTYLQEEFAKLLGYCNACIEHGVNVVFLAHAKMRKFEQPDEMGAYDRWELKLTKQVAPMLKEWADMVLFLNYQTYLVEDDQTKSKKAKGGKRIIYTSHNPCWDAKNRHGLPDELPLAWKSPLSDLFVETANATASAAVVTFGGEITDNFGNSVNTLPNAEVVEKLAESEGLWPAQIIAAMVKNDMAKEGTENLADVDDAELETVITYWEDFKQVAAQQEVDVPF